MWKKATSNRFLKNDPKTLDGTMLTDIIEIFHEIGFEGQALRQVVAAYIQRSQPVEKPTPQPEVMRLRGLSPRFDHVAPQVPDSVEAESIFWARADFIDLSLRDLPSPSKAGSRR
ncbi:hypothetical protein C4J81_16520 [Deltaproteobacteria bacterium Smac51]|nr:hypothetical protein C4J81_16520 [Deltaproteobacteria bacterium Smac51]